MSPLKEQGYPKIVYKDHPALVTLKAKDDISNGGKGITAVRRVSIEYTLIYSLIILSFCYTPTPIPQSQFVWAQQEGTNALSIAELHPAGVNGLLTAHESVFL